MDAPRVLISVSDKSGVAEFANELVALGWEIIASGGTANHLLEHGVSVIQVEDVTDFPEILDGRVKTLHPNIFGGILADRCKQDHLFQLVEQDIEPVEMVVCNFYPFVEQPSVEMIDIGGPAMIRAAAKNSASVVVLVSPQDYALVLGELRAGGDVSAVTRNALAKKAFETTAAYDAAVVSWLDR